jgi:hypothetical protein
LFPEFPPALAGGLWQKEDLALAKLVARRIEPTLSRKPIFFGSPTP